MGFTIEWAGTLKVRCTQQKVDVDNPYISNSLIYLEPELLVWSDEEALILWDWVHAQALLSCATCKAFDSSVKSKQEAPFFSLEFLAFMPWELWVLEIFFDSGFIVYDQWSLRLTHQRDQEIVLVSYKYFGDLLTVSLWSSHKLIKKKYNIIHIITYRYKIIYNIIELSNLFHIDGNLLSIQKEIALMLMENKTTKKWKRMEF